MATRGKGQQGGLCAQRKSAFETRGIRGANQTCDLNKEVVCVKTLSVEGTEDMPAPPDFSPDVWSPDLQRVARAGWLAENGGSRWRLEAFWKSRTCPMIWALRWCYDEMRLWMGNIRI
jgi:hypothetical protein